VKPYYEDSESGVTLYHADYRDALPALNLGGFCVISDPPFGIGYVHSGIRGRIYTGPSVAGNHERSVGRDRRRIKGDDEPFDPAPWLSFPCLLWGANHFAQRLPVGGTWLAWDKSPDRRGPADSSADGEFAWCSVPKIKRNVFRFLWKGVACEKAGENNGRRWHPSQKPLSLLVWCLKLLPELPVLDPFCGSGTTLVAARDAGRKAVGIEIEERYCEIAARRLSQRVFDF
jgi:site-specific DNA-methyltransferase (adenine-specific)